MRFFSSLQNNANCLPSLFISDYTESRLTVRIDLCVSIQGLLLCSFLLHAPSLEQYLLFVLYRWNNCSIVVRINQENVYNFCEHDGPALFTRHTQSHFIHTLFVQLANAFVFWCVKTELIVYFLLLLIAFIKCFSIFDWNVPCFYCHPIDFLSCVWFFFLSFFALLRFARSAIELVPTLWNTHTHSANPNNQCCLWPQFDATTEYHWGQLKLNTSTHYT